MQQANCVALQMTLTSEPMTTEQESRATRDELVRANTRFAYSIAMRFASQLPLDDAVSTAYVGLCEAAKRYDPAHGHRFITYATWWVHQVLRAEVDKYRDIRPPASVVSEAWALSQKMEDPLAASPAEAAETMGWTLAKARHVQQCFLRPMDMDAPGGPGDARPLSEVVTYPIGSGPFASPEWDDTGEQIERAMACLSVRERQILTRRFGLDGQEPETLAEVAADYGCTRERGRQIQDRAMKSG